MSKSHAFARPTRLHSAIRSALLASALATGGILSQTALAEKPDPALYDQDTEQLLIYLHDGIKPDDLAKRYGLKPVRTLVSKINAHVFATDSVESARKLLPALRQDSAVKAAFNNRRVVRVPMSYDPLYLPSDYSEFGQWHLNNNQGWPHIQAEGAWNLAVTGNKVVIGIVDTGVDPFHPDLSLVQDLSFDFVHNNNELTPCMDVEQCPSGYHGTAVAGLAAAIGFNELGGRGVAYRAQVATLRIPLVNSYECCIPDTALSDRFVDAIHFGSQAITIKNHSWGVAVGSEIVTDDSAENYAVQQTTADGMIHIKAAGNERMDWNRKAAANIPEQIVVTALAAHDQYAYYSNYGAGVFVTAPSGDSKWGVELTTTTLTKILLEDIEGYTTSFSGTSAATPQVAGALALAQEVRPDLETRLAKHLLVNSSKLIDLEDDSSVGGWTRNQAGCAFNPNYGFGLLNAERLVNLAGELTISPLLELDRTARHAPLNIPDQATTPLTIAIPVEVPTYELFPGIRPEAKPLEEVGITVDINHTRRGDVEIVLISPSGTRSRLRYGYDDIADPFGNPAIRRTYWSNAYWGETPSGTWTLEIYDKVSGESGVVNKHALHLRMGSVTAPAGFKVCAQHQEVRR